MKRLIALAALIVLGGCAALRSNASVAASTIHAALPPSAVSSTTADATTPAVVPQAAEISDDPLVRLLASLTRPEDVAVSLQINALSNDKMMEQCTAFTSAPGTAQRVAGLANLKGTFQIVPIKPVGPLSIIAEARRVDRDVSSGALAARIAAKRVELDALRTDFVMACGPFLTDVRTAPARFGAIAAAAGSVIH